MMNNITRHLLFFTTTIFLILSNIHVVANNDYFHIIDTSKGLPSNTIGALKKDSLGFIWIGTKFGICRYDGCNLKQYDKTKSDDIFSIEELNNDTMLIGGIKGIKYLNRKTGETNSLDIPNITKSIIKINNNSFLAGSENGLYYVNNNTIKQIIIETNFSSSNHITSIIKGDNKVYWISTADGLARLDMESQKVKVYRTKPNIENTNHFICLTKLKDKIYLGSFNKGIFCFDIKSNTFSKVNGFENNMIMTIYGHEDRLFIGTNGRGFKILSIDTGEIKIITNNKKDHNSISANTITSYLYDNGVHWIGTQFGGLNYTPQTDAKFSYYNKYGFYSTDYMVRSIYIYPDNNKLIGTRNGLFYVNNKTQEVKSFTIYNNENMRSDIILHLAEINGNILVGTYGGGMYRFNTEKQCIENIKNDELFQYGCIFHFTESKNKILWIATQDGLYKCTEDYNILHKFNTLNSLLPTYVIYYLYVDTLNRLWIGTKFGLVVLDIDTEKMSTALLDKINGEVKFIMEDSKHNIWICTDSGVFETNKDFKIIRHLSTDNILPDNYSQSICERKNSPGEFWIALRNQLMRYNSNDSTYYVYQLQDGLNGQDFNNYVYKSNNNTIWWPNECGLIFTSDNDSVESHSHNIQTNPTIISCNVSNRFYDMPCINNPNGITLKNYENNIEFKLSNMNFSLPHTNIYEFKLEGYDTKWKRQEGNNIVLYKDLKPGEYTFKIRNPYNLNISQTINLYINKSYTVIIWSVISAILIAMVMFVFIYKIWKLKTRIKKNIQIMNVMNNKKNNNNDSLNDNLLNRLLQYMEDEKPYLKSKLTIADVASYLKCDESELSQLLNTNMDINFANFINLYRVTEVKTKLDNGFLSKYTQTALAEQCGFSSKTTFYRVFKNVTGMTPLEYYKSKNLINESAEIEE